MSKIPLDTRPPLPARTSSREARASALVALLESASLSGYIGEQISQLEHGLQAAYFATRAQASGEEILAALLHDIGHISAPPEAAQMEGLGVVSHESIGANLLRELGYPARLAVLVEGHVQAKRYLVSSTPGYLERLSPASRRTLDFQGGPMSEAERRAFESDPDFKAKLRVRSWDEQAKVVGLAVPAARSYLDLLRQHLSD